MVSSVVDVAMAFKMMGTWGWSENATKTCRGKEYEALTALGQGMHAQRMLQSRSTQAQNGVKTVAVASQMLRIPLWGNPFLTNF